MYVQTLRICTIILVVLFLSPFTVLAEKGEGMVIDLYQNDKSNSETVENEAPSDNKNASSDTNESNATFNPEEGPSVTAWDFIKMFLTLAFVLLLLLFTLKFINKKGQLSQTNNVLKNVGGTSLGNNKSVQLVKVGDSILVLGVGDSINLIKEITNEVEQESILEAYKDKSESMITLNKEQLTSTWKKLKEISSKEGKENNKSDFSSLLKAQLKDLTEERKNKIKYMEKKVESNE